MNLRSDNEVDLAFVIMQLQRVCRFVIDFGHPHRIAQPRRQEAEQLRVMNEQVDVSLLSR
jgi:hypothetical protein